MALTSREIAEAIYSIENADLKTKREWMKAGTWRWKLGDGVYLEETSNLLSWNVWQFDEADMEYRYKVLPRAHYRAARLETILEAQAWVHI